MDGRAAVPDGALESVEDFVAVFFGGAEVLCHTYEVGRVVLGVMSSEAYRLRHEKPG